MCNTLAIYNKISNLDGRNEKVHTIISVAILDVNIGAVEGSVCTY